MDWTEILTAMAAIGTIGSFIVAFYRWVYYPHKEKTFREKEEIYKPLYHEIEKLINSVKNFEEERCRQPHLISPFWRKARGKARPDLYGK